MQFSYIAYHAFSNRLTYTSLNNVSNMLILSCLYVKLLLNHFLHLKKSCSFVHLRFVHNFMRMRNFFLWSTHMGRSWVADVNKSIEINYVYKLLVIHNSLSVAQKQITCQKYSVKQLHTKTEVDFFGIKDFVLYLCLWLLSPTSGHYKLKSKVFRMSSPFLQNEAILKVCSEPPSSKTLGTVMEGQ